MFSRIIKEASVALDCVKPGSVVRGDVREVAEG